ncbi:MAG: hypothetical protein LC737_00205 [Chloroflexi bacterium]|nr:hypothetical protein [Chloroflexota bacterium]
MAEATLQQAAQTLLDHYGARFETGKDEGRRLMAETLEQRLGMSNHDAKKLVDDLVEAHTIRWTEGSAARADEPSDRQAILPGAVAQESDRVFGAVLGRGGGYWQLGDDQNPT